ncbi:hypothetical protein CTI12_AA036570 [Artemisia annua]|uniref:Uncharacterized protein n=1 Tax=Artemisia annua TaxID=35608 RepID=A0A2U1QFJ8_ARTAN|nr:hypothetical protein CTI12_AA036570 [Artemisia annua]
MRNRIYCLSCTKQKNCITPKDNFFPHTLTTTMSITSPTIATTIFSEKMGGLDPVPIEIGARGTVGNLVMKEIEYFRRLEIGGCSNVGDHGKFSIRDSNIPDKKHRKDGGSSNFWPSFGFLTITWRKVKRKGTGSSGRFLPRMCTMVDVAESPYHKLHRLSKIPSFSYQNLKDDNNQSDV